MTAGVIFCFYFYFDILFWQRTLLMKLVCSNDFTLRKFHLSESRPEKVWLKSDAEISAGNFLTDKLTGFKGCFFTDPGSMEGSLEPI